MINSIKKIKNIVQEEINKLKKNNYCNNIIKTSSDQSEQIYNNIDLKEKIKNILEIELDKIKNSNSVNQEILKDKQINNINNFILGICFIGIMIATTFLMLCFCIIMWFS
jgi:hypothetical protein